MARWPATKIRKARAGCSFRSGDRNIRSSRRQSSTARCSTAPLRHSGWSGIRRQGDSSSNPAWISRDMKHADPPVVANGIVFGYASGEDIVLRPPPMPFGTARRGRRNTWAHLALHTRGAVRVGRTNRRRVVVERRTDYVVESLQRHLDGQRPGLHRDLRRHRLLFRIAAMRRVHCDPHCCRSSFAAAVAGMLHAQARSAPDWTTQGFDAQRTSWMRVDPYISLENLSKFQFLWKLKVDNESRHGNSLTAPVALGNLMTFRGFKSLIFVGGSSNNVYAHRLRLRDAVLENASQLHGGRARVCRIANLSRRHDASADARNQPERRRRSFRFSDSRGRRVPQKATSANRARARRSSPKSRHGCRARESRRWRPHASAANAATAGKPAAPLQRRRAGRRLPARGAGSARRSRGRGPNFVFSVAADGLLRGLIPDTGDLAARRSRFLPANATANGLIWTDGCRLCRDVEHLRRRAGSRVGDGLHGR